MRKVATAFLAISLLATTPVFAAEQEKNQEQQVVKVMDGGVITKELTGEEIMSQEGVKSALEKFYDKYPQAKAYEISGNIIKNEETSRLKLFIISQTESFILDFDQEQITNYSQINKIPEVELEGPIIQGVLNKIYSLLPEAKDLKLYHFESYSTNIKGKEQPKTYSLSFNESGKRKEGKTNDKEFFIMFDETGKVLYFEFEDLSLVNLEGNTKDEKAQDLLKRLYGEEANEYKIKKVNEISKDEDFDSRRGNIVFMPTSSEKDPILVRFNPKDELTTIQVTTRDFLEDIGLLQ